jgi:predicted permease
VNPANLSLLFILIFLFRTPNASDERERERGKRKIIRIMKLLRQLLALFRKEKLDAEMSKEMRAHLELQTQQNLARGMPPDEARYAARRAFGGEEQIKERCRDERRHGWLWLDQALQDIRYAARQLRRSPGFATVAVLSLGLGIGANTAIFSLVDAVLLKMLPVKKPEDLVLFQWVMGPKGFPVPLFAALETDPKTKRTLCASLSKEAFERFRSQSGNSLSDVFAFVRVPQPTLVADGLAEVGSAQLISGGYHAGLGVPALIGRTLTAEDDRPGAAPAAVISHGYWQRRFGGDVATIGKSLVVNGAVVTIVGVTPPGFFGALDVGVAPDVSLPLALLPQVDGQIAEFTSRPGGLWWLRVMGRLKPGVTREQAEADLGGVFRRVATASLAAAGQPAAEPPSFVMAPGGQGLNQQRHHYRQRLMILTGLVALVLLIACVNVANLLVARGASRRREIAARLALGASRRRLVRQLLTESALLVFLGGTVGGLIAHWGRGLLLTMNVFDEDGGRTLALLPALDLRVLGFTLAVAALTGLLFGLVPALRATRVDLSAEFQGGAKTLGGSRSRLARTLMTVQIALSLVLLVGAGLFGRTLAKLEGIGVGFARERLLLFSLNARPPAYDAARGGVLHERVRAAVAAIPGVRGVTYSQMPLLSRRERSTGIGVPGRTPPSNGRPETALLNIVDSDFFTTLGMPILLGRGFTAADHAQASRVAVINEAMAQKFFPDQNPIGRRFNQARSGSWEMEVVGVVRNAKYSDVKNGMPATVYVPFAQSPGGEASYAVRTEGDPLAFVGVIRAAVRAIDPNLPLADVRTQEAQIEKLFADERMLARFSTFFSGLALALVGVGLFGLMSYTVARRTSEIGLRIALGAEPRRVQASVLRESLMLVAIGTAVGLGVAGLASKTVEKMLYGVERSDPMIYATATVLLLAVAVIAAWLPARRAAKVNPVVALRAE